MRLYFLDSSTTHIPTCFSAKYPEVSAFYCPTSTQNLTAKIHDYSGQVSLNVNFGVANALNLAPVTTSPLTIWLGPVSPQARERVFRPATSTGACPSSLAGTCSLAIEGEVTPGHAGPFVAF